MTKERTHKQDHRGEDGFLVVNHLAMSYPERGTQGKVIAIEGLTFSVNEGEVVSIVGETGCGKSTFVRLLLGLEAPDSGVLEVDGRRPFHDFKAMKGVIGVVFQEDRLLPWRTAIGNVKVGLELMKYSKTEQEEVASAWLRRVGLEKFRDAYPHELSGGMRQRVAIARACATDPRLLIGDEAFGHLDEVTAERLRGEFLEQVTSLGATTIFVTHQLEEALTVGHRTLVFGRPARLLADIDSRHLSASQAVETRTEIQRLLGSTRGVSQRLMRSADPGA